MPFELDPGSKKRASRQFSRRSALLFGGQLMVMGGLAWRMHQLQIRDADSYQRIAEGNRISLRALPAQRSDILDRHGVPLATIRPSLSVYLVRQRAQDPERALADVARVAGLSAEEHARILARLREERTAHMVLLLDNADWRTAARLSANAPGLPGIQIAEFWERTYPDGAAFAHVVGYVGAISDRDLAREPALQTVRSIPDMRIGKRGVERSRDSILRGAPGTRHVEVNAHGRVIRELRRTPARSGTDIALALDGPLQRYARARFDAQTGAVVVMDVHSGDLHCLYSSPSFDPNLFAAGIGEQDWQALNQNPRKPLVDRALTGEYAPGSTFKVAVALAALESGLFVPQDTQLCTGRTELGGRTFHCWKRGGHGQIGMHRAIQQSCDVYFYLMADRIGPERIASMARRLGFGHQFELGVPQGRAGIVPSPDWKRTYLDEPWTRGDNFNTAIGQGFMLATPLQMATMIARVANGAQAVVPRLITADDPAADAPALDLHPNHLAVIRDALFAVCNEPRGTAYDARIKEPGLAMAGKTGTSQVRGISPAERASAENGQEERPWHLRDHGMFVGYAPAQAPRFATAVVVEHGGSGSRSAAPIARDLLHRALADAAVRRSAPGA